MKILISIILNAFILFAIAYFLSGNTETLSPWVVLGCGECSYTSIPAIKIYILWGIVLGILNVVVRPILKILSLPLFFIFFGLVIFLINGIVLYLFSFILNDVLQIPNVGYEIVGWANFIIAVAIFSVLNTLYALLFFKK